MGSPVRGVYGQYSPKTKIYRNFGLMIFGAGNSAFRGVEWSTQTELRKRGSYTFYGLQKHTCNAVET